MSTKILNIFIFIALIAIIVSCRETKKENTVIEKTEMEKLVDNYAEVELTADLSHLSQNQKNLISKLIEVSDIMEELFWKDAIGDKEEFLSQITDEAAKKYAMINYGPWDRLNGNQAFLEVYGKKPEGANYYPADITEQEFEEFTDENKNSWYTLIRRNDDRSLKCVWYHEEYSEQIEKAAQLLDEASELAENEEFKKYLKLRATALRTDDYFESDLAWMDMKTNKIDFVVGPIESYEDGFKGLKAAHSGQVLIKDLEWSKNIERFNQVLPQLQAGLPVSEQYKPEVKEDGESSTGDMNVYNVIYYGGDCNAGSKNIAINLPNDPNVHEAKGSRKLQLKNSMKAKFDKILIPIAELLIDESQMKHIKFEDAFFQNVMFHEVAHGLGVKFLVNENKSVRDALEEYYSSIEEAKADIAGLYMVTQLYEMGEFPEKDLMDNYVTFIAGIFRSVRFGAASAHGQANMLEFNYLKEKGAFTKNETTGKYTVNFEKMKDGISQLVNEIIIMQGDGNKELAREWIETMSKVTSELQADLDKIAAAGIPKDIVFKQGKSILGL
ncbi:Zn-dependent hydrolase [Bacteroidales bacterium OttesenSCG-928-I21]|nr:Zn-dependent hydrolase [Bacteroidales bacterium OttesenSCG-928-I21]